MEEFKLPSSGGLQKRDILDTLRKIEDSLSALNNPEEKQKQEVKLVQTVSNYMKECGLLEVEDWSACLNNISGNNPGLLVRRANPENVFDTISKKKDLTISFDSKEASDEKCYPNAAVLGGDSSGLRIPFTQGFNKVSTGAIVIVLGFNAGEDMKIEKIGEDELVHMNNIDRDKVRKISGSTKFSNIKFVLIRYPKNLFPEDMMTENEKENENIKTISRVFEIER